MKIMLVHDQEAALVQTVQKLKDKGYEVVTANSFDEAVAVFTANADLEFVITKWNLFEDDPNKDGCDLCRRMRQLATNFKVIYVLVSPTNASHVEAKWEDAHSLPYDYFIQNSIGNGGFSNTVYDYMVEQKGKPEDQKKRIGYGQGSGRFTGIPSHRWADLDPPKKDDDDW